MSKGRFCGQELCPVTVGLVQANVMIRASGFPGFILATGGCAFIIVVAANWDRLPGLAAYLMTILTTRVLPPIIAGAIPALIVLLALMVWHRSHKARQASEAPVLDTKCPACGQNGFIQFFIRNAE